MEGNMTGIIKEDLPAHGLKKGDEVRVLSTNKKLGRKTIKTKEGVVVNLDAWRVQETLGGGK